jgi:transcriptional regulator with XRE-family HTH domain
MTALSDKLKAWRKRLDITQAQAADVLGVSKRTYEGWEIGRTERLHERVFDLAMMHVENNRKKFL